MASLLPRLAVATAISATLVGAAGCPHSRNGDGAQRDEDPHATPEDCAALRAQWDAIYREAAATEKVAPARIDEFVSDNLTMIENDCKEASGRVLPCLRDATTSVQLEDCLLPLDDEGTAEARRFGSQP